ncbi:MAG: sodium:proton antiporter [Sulfolobales archaeon]|nr:sodium:proton antiporter [Sulfolobales archaeon]MDW8083345.1 sodium:proton antiporter [Sulfolobales archaeon]
MSTSFLENFFITLILYNLLVAAGISIYGVVARPSITKKIISLTILQDTFNILAIFLGFKVFSIPPVLLELDSDIEKLLAFTTSAVDPLPQALVLTAIVIGLAVNLFLIFLALQVFRLYRTLDSRKIKELKG